MADGREGKGRAEAGVWVWPRDGARARRWTAPAAATLEPTLAKLRAWLRAETGDGRLLPWVPVAFGTGIALYFSADREPVAWLAATVALAAFGAAVLLRHRKAFAATLMLAAMVAGFAVAALRTAWVAHPVLAQPIYSAALQGFVEAREARERTDRFVLRVTELTAARGAVALKRVRLAVRKGTAPPVGSFVALKARLLPPLSPLRPGAYDFGRDLYFQGIGASGFVMGAIGTRDPPAGGGWRLRYATIMQDLRDAIDARIRTALDGDNRAIATALLTGRRDAITPPVNDAMFVSGLGHVLSISGYHMAVVAGVVFFAVRALLALVPGLTVTFPIKKWAALAALAAATFYLLLSGAEVATRRSYFMTAVVLIAVMADRRAVTFRTLAIAAMIVLIAAPESLVHPSFQMSFAATLGLVALVQIGMPKLFAAPDNSAAARAALWGGREIVTLALASLVAGLATMPYAAFHFHRVTPYGVLANLAAMPVVSGVVMPAGLIGLIAAPFGLDRVFWDIMGLGIDWMIAVAVWVAALPGAIGRMAAFGSGPLLLASLGIVLLGLLRTPLRWSGGVALAAATAWAVSVAQPDVLVAGDGHSVAVRGDDGRLRMMQSAKNTFLVREWLAADADGRGQADAALTAGVSCDPAGCVAPLRDGRLVALALRPEAFDDDCTRAAIIVTRHDAPPDCAALVIDQAKLRNHGALALRKAGRGFAVTAIRRDGVDRPWSPAASAETATPATTARPRIAPPIDATPPETDRQPDD
ncbi:MAG: ComEC family competence protein [Xanthobacteraceae bacterium]|nr:ComEC family competence protein [Xanthobacteraceae bacterium]